MLNKEHMTDDAVDKEFVAAVDDLFDYSTGIPSKYGPHGTEARIRMLLLKYRERDGTYK